MADNTVTGAVTSSIRPQARPKAVSGIGAKAPARQEEKAELSFMDRITNLFTGFGGKDPKEKPASVNTYNAKISVYQDMEDEARRSAELHRQDRQGMGITQSLTPEQWAQRYSKEKGVTPNTTPPFWYQGQEHPEALTPAPVEAAAIPAQTTGEGLMARSGTARAVVGATGDEFNSNAPLGDPSRVRAAYKFYKNIGVYAESDHGSTPVATNDAGEADLPEAERTRDIGYGHKIKPQEEESGLIHGIRFMDAAGNYIALTEEDKIKILNADMQELLRNARKDTSQGDGWDTKLKNLGTNWYELDPKYQLALTSLAFNARDAGRKWTAVLSAAVDKDPIRFAQELRRKDAGRYTAGMDNRVLKELYYAGIITNRSQVSDVLPLGDARSGVPE